MNTFFLMTVALLVSACGAKTSGTAKLHQGVSESEPVLERPLEVTQKETVKFHRQEQMTSRYDCKQALVTRRLETVSSLSQSITIDYENRKKAWNYSVYNRRTKSSNRGAFKKEGKFMVDYRPTVFNMQIKPGINDVEYVFKKCSELSPDKSQCLKLEVEKEGIVQIDLYYSSEVLPQERHIHPSPESCQAGA
ncbi:MAG TPA: hypothetical protein VNJ01_17850 [Bacteriovoracaceae bacterium]|nr:hypothetical protein [Bacteriovoracaceae bacterium]